MVDQKPGATSQRAGRPAIVRPATAPWFNASPQCSTRSGRPAAALCAKAASPATSTSGALVRMEASAATAPFAMARQARSASPTRGRAPVPSRTRSAGCSVPSAARTTRPPRGPGAISSTATPSARPTPSSASQPAMRRPASAPRRSDCGHGSGATSVTPQPAHAQRGGRLAADEAGADDGDPGAGPGADRERLRVGDRPQHAHRGVVGARDRRAHRLRSRRQQAGVERQLLAATGHHPPADRVDLGGRGPQAQRHPVRRVPARGLDRQLRAGEPAAQELLAEGRAGDRAARARPPGW